MTTNTPDAMLADLEQARAAMLDPLDVPRTWTQRQLNAYEARRQRLANHISGLRNVSLSSASHLYAKRDELLGLKAALEKQVAEAPDPSTIGDSRGRDREWERQQWLADSLKALQHGVRQWPNGMPAIPKPLADLLRKTCATCGHTELTWPGTIPEVEAEIAAAERKIKEQRGHLDALLAGAAALLAETVTV